MFRGPDWKIIFCPSLLRLTNRSWSISYSSHEPQCSRKLRQPDRRLSTAGDIYVEQKTANVVEREIEKRIILLPTEDYSCSNHHRSILGDNKPQVDIFPPSSLSSPFFFPIFFRSLVRCVRKLGILFLGRLYLLSRRFLSG